MLGAHDQHETHLFISDGRISGRRHPGFTVDDVLVMRLATGAVSQAMTCWNQLRLRAMANTCRSSSFTLINPTKAPSPLLCLSPVLPSHPSHEPATPRSAEAGNPSLGNGVRLCEGSHRQLRHARPQTLQAISMVSRCHRYF